ncbi:MAG: sulfatase-like hydrolase/transferase [Lachnospiraceae bacterium]|nr:sulfatase-like hydrolase/transferase [Lachnospiraceae bacterium]
MKIPKTLYHTFIFPAAFLYFEILLRLFGKTGLFSHLIYPVLFGLGAGCLFSCIVSLFSDRVNRMISLILLFASGLIYLVECMVKQSMQYYMPFSSIFSVAGSVVGGYTQQVMDTILFGLPAIVLFFLPAFLYLVFGRKYVPSFRQDRRISLLLLGTFFLFTGTGILAAGHGSSADTYKKQYRFDTAACYFGLASGLQLDVFYSLFGNSDADTLVVFVPTDSSDPDSENPSSNAGNSGDPEITAAVSGGALSGIASSDIGNDISEADGNSGETPYGGAAAAPETTPEPTPTEKVYAKNEMDLPLDEISASTADETLRSMNEYVKSIPASTQNDYTGLFAGKNLILICAEALSDAVIDETLTPTLYRLTHNGFYFSEYYQPNWGGSTSTGEYSMLLGIAPLLDIRTMPATQGKNLYFTMGNQLHRLGYTGNAYHNGGYEYYSRNLTHQNLGYDEYIALGSGLEDLTQWWPTDGQMFDATLPTYIDQQPFSVYYMTGSAHFPYKAEDGKTLKNIEYVQSIMGDRHKDKTLYYLCYQMELEYGLASMVEQLEAAGITDDTVICITSDHYPYGLENSRTFGNSEDYLADLYGSYPQNDWEQDRNAWILWSGCLEHEYKDMVCEISTPTYSLDILPTLSNLFGLEYDSRLLVGRDVFSEAEPLALWTNHSWVTTEGKYDSSTGTFYPNEGSAVGPEYVEQIKTIVANKLSFSGKILNYDYYRILLGDN